MLTFIILLLDAPYFVAKGIPQRQQPNEKQHPGQEDREQDRFVDQSRASLRAKIRCMMMESVAARVLTAEALERIIFVAVDINMDRLRVCTNSRHYQQGRLLLAADGTHDCP